jgi:hypothetical protein
MTTTREGARPRAMKARDAARYIACGRTKLKQLIASGAFPGAYKNGRDHVVPVGDLDAYVDAQAAAARATRSNAPFVEPPPSPLISDALSHSTASTGLPPREAQPPHASKSPVRATPAQRPANLPVNVGMHVDRIEGQSCNDGLQIPPFLRRVRSEEADK